MQAVRVDGSHGFAPGLPAGLAGKADGAALGLIELARGHFVAGDSQGGEHILGQEPDHAVLGERAYRDVAEVEGLGGDVVCRDSTDGRGLRSHDWPPMIRWSTNFASC